MTKKQEESMFIIREGIKDLVTLCHSRSKAAGWWDGQDWARDANVVAAKLALIHSEISEALEGARKGIMDDHLPHRTMFEAVATVVELGSHYGYGNLISHLQTAWARHLMATMGLSEQSARAASGGRGYDFDWQAGILEAAKKARAKK